MIEATALATPWQVRFRSGTHEGVADTCKDGVGGAAGLRPHELLEAALASCMTITARQALAELGEPDAEVSVRVHVDRAPSVTRFRYELILDPAHERHRPVIMGRLATSPVRTTLSNLLVFEAV
ncbi:MAG: OsmC family protein [Actinomycetes bacterium]|jgi:putative redox protein|nr:MAG: hypothetical protein DIU60_08485 [Actinomycetota bacterium]